MGTLDPQAKTILDMMAASGAPTMDTLSPPLAREAFLKACSMLQAPKPEMASVKDIHCTGPGGKIPLRVYRPAGSKESETLPVLVYFHGGGWVIGDLESHDESCRTLANASGACVVAVGYRLAPEHKFPSAVEDCIAATEYVAANAATLHLDATRLAVGGDSAGGNLAAVVSLATRDSGKAKVRFQLLIYPVTDLRGQSGSYKELADGYFLTKNLMHYFVNHYLNGPKDQTDWRASPLLASDHKGLPPAYVLTCGFDPLRDEGNAYAEKLRAAGVPVTQRKFDGQIHGFLLMTGAIAEAPVSVAEMGTALREALG